jgi:hypothetical protein
MTICGKDVQTTHLTALPFIYYPIVVNPKFGEEQLRMLRCAQHDIGYWPVRMIAHSI